MLSRRHLRIKVMQALYAFFQSENADLAKGEKELFHSIDKVYELYAWLLLTPVEIRDHALRIQEEGRIKRLPTQEELSPNTRFTDNSFIKKLENNRQLLKQVSSRKLSWHTEPEIFKKLFLEIRETDEYKKYMSAPVSGFKEDRDFIEYIFRNHIAENDLLLHFFEDKSIYWLDDMNLVEGAVVKTIQSFTEVADEFFPLLPLYKEEQEDVAFVKDLFRKTILHEKEYEKLIGEKTKNWEVERIAMMDVLLMKMALSEILNFSYIPVKVSFNEYIDISKNYSTPKSRQFINGILDKLVMDLKRDGKIKKSGRGLIE